MFMPNGPSQTDAIFQWHLTGKCRTEAHPPPLWQPDQDPIGKLLRFRRILTRSVAQQVARLICECSVDSAINLLSLPP